ncbi:MAG: phosphoglucomutase/phosphomannomutase family protein [Acidobacteriota bacterium]
MIKFGTSGWRAIIGDGFTFENVRRLSDAIAETILEGDKAERGVLFGFDTRFLSEHFAEEAAGVVAARGIRCVVSNTALPTPAVSHAIRHHGFAGAVNITASHNPAEYNGLKFSADTGAPAPIEVTRGLEEKIAARASAPAPARRADADGLERVDVRDEYLKQLESLVQFDAIRDAGVRVVLDPRWGTARGFYDELLTRHGIPVRVIHDRRDVTFGGQGPDVTERNLEELGRAVVEGGYTLGLACDGDADRFGVVDVDGTWISPNLLLALLADYLADTRGFRQGLGRTYATTGLIDAVARHYKVPVVQTPVGFKYLGEQILHDKVYLAGEESAGMSMAGHVPEKDGLLAGLLAAEMTARRKCSLKRMRDDLFAKVGTRYSARRDLRVTPEQAARLRSHMASPPERIGGRIVSQPTVLDGLRLDFDDGAWMLMRPSGTEPVVRFYVEALTQADLQQLLVAGERELIGGDG